jgi:hypothetical protein
MQILLSLIRFLVIRRIFFIKITIKRIQSRSISIFLSIIFVFPLQEMLQITSNDRFPTSFESFCTFVPQLLSNMIRKFPLFSATIVLFLQKQKIRFFLRFHCFREIVSKIAINLTTRSCNLNFYRLHSDLLKAKLIFTNFN